MANILLISHSFAVTGAPNSLLRQAKYFRKAGHNVEVWSLGNGVLKERYFEEGFNPVVLENNVLSVRKYYEKRKKHFDFVLCNTIVTYKAIFALHKYNIPTVWFIRETKLLDDYMRKDAVFAKHLQNLTIYTLFQNMRQV